MGSLSDYLELELLDHVFGGGSRNYTPPNPVYIGLSTADPTDSGGGLAEPSGNGYARQSIAFNAAATRKIENTSQVTFPQATGSWGTITHYALFDAVSGGNMMAHGALTTAKEVVAGNTPSIAAQEVDVSWNAGEFSDYIAHALLDFAFRNQSYTAPTVYIALCTADISDTDDGDSITEPSGNNYGRKQHSGDSNWTVAAAGALENEGDITFNTPSGSWGLITAAAICDAATSGEVLWYENTITEQTPDNGDTVKFPDGDLDVSMD